MTDDELDRALRDARPPTAADVGWVTSADGDAALAAIRAAASDSRRVRELQIRLPRRRVLAGLVAAAAVVTAGAAALGFHQDASIHVASGRTDRPTSRTLPTVRPDQLLLTGYDTCTSALAGLRAHAAAQATGDGLPYPAPYAYGTLQNASLPAAASGTAVRGSSAADAPAHSGTNDQVAGADEPDTIKTDGRRIVTVSGGVLRVTDAASHTITGQLDLGAYTGSDDAQLLLSGDRVLVLLGNAQPDYGFGPAALPMTTGSTTVLLIDLGGGTPSLVSMFRPKGTLVDARLVDGTARLVVRSSPTLNLRTPHERTAKARQADYRRQLAREPISAWLPSWSVTSGGSTGEHTLGCGDLSHPVSYTALSTLTVYSVDPAAGFGDVAPVSLAADANTVYADTTSLYVASDTAVGSSGDTTELHRFDISRPGRPTYLGSGTVPGTVATSYSMDEWRGSLRVVTTSDGTTETHAVYVLDAATLKVTGHVGGIGTGEDLHAVRFLGGLGYVVTYEQIDPLFVLDLRDPAHPRVTAHLTLTGYSGYLDDVGGGRLLGVGEATVPSRIEPGRAHPIGLQLQLFDVTSPSRPTALAKLVRSNSFGDGDIDPHAFLYWAPQHLAVVPLGAWDTGESGAALLVRVGATSLRTVATVANPGSGGGDGITRTLVIGDQLWTFSPAGLAATDLSTLQRAAWVSFS